MYIFASVFTFCFHSHLPFSHPWSEVKRRWVEISADKTENMNCETCASVLRKLLLAAKNCQQDNISNFFLFFFHILVHPLASSPLGYDSYQLGKVKANTCILWNMFKLLLMLRHRAGNTLGGKCYLPSSTYTSSQIPVAYLYCFDWQG